MYTRFNLPFAALVLAAPASLAAQSVQEFQLPPNPTPTASPTVQGPVDTEGSAVPARPRVIATPTPAPTATQAPSATVQPLPEPTPTPTPLPRTANPTVQRPVPAPTVQSAPVPQRDIVPMPVPASDLPVPTPAPTQPEVTDAVPPPAPATIEEQETAQQPEWLWPAAGGGFLALLGIGYLVSRRRRNAEPPQIERPVVASGAGTAVAPADLQLRAEAIKLTRSVMNATLHYRVHVLNRSTGALSGVALGADVVSAHGGLPVEEQVASSAQLLEQRHVFERIAPGQSVRYEGQLTIPLSQARVIRQGNAALFVPLLRVRVDGVGDEPLVKTFVIGQGVPDGERVSPFRLDEGPRSYQPIAARALD